MKLTDDIREALKRYRDFIKKETTETRDMLITFRDLLHDQLGGNKNPTEKEIREAIKQLKDVGKITALTPLLVLPGSVLTIPILVRLGKKFGIDILPS